ncbi:MAG: hypothetical protein HN922_06495, partial [Anaerolineae bacterium]|nr:hypothetical protein [Anaerolineae bacterium]
MVELGRVRYAITTEESEARFNMDETIGGEDIIVIGVTSEIAGEVIVDFDSPITSQVGMIRINVR